MSSTDPRPAPAHLPTCPSREVWGLSQGRTELCLPAPALLPGSSQPRPMAPGPCNCAHQEPGSRASLPQRLSRSNLTPGAGSGAERPPPFRISPLTPWPKPPVSLPNLSSCSAPLTVRKQKAPGEAAPGSPLGAPAPFAPPPPAHLPQLCVFSCHSASLVLRARATQHPAPPCITAFRHAGSALLCYPSP